MVIYADIDGDCSWHKFDGPIEDAKKIGLCMVREFDGTFGSQTIASMGRPGNYGKLSSNVQWDIDKNLGILDWSGNPKD